MNIHSKITLVNTLFFGIVGPYIGGIIPFFLIGQTFNNQDSFLLVYLISCPTIGLIPACWTGYFYSKRLKKEYSKSNSISFTKELKIGSLISFSAMISLSVIIVLFLVANRYLQGGSLHQIKDLLKNTWPLFGILTSFGVFAACCCAILMRRWNQKNCAQNTTHSL